MALGYVATSAAHGLIKGVLLGGARPPSLHAMTTGPVVEELIYRAGPHRLAAQLGAAPPSPWLTSAVFALDHLHAGYSPLGRLVRFADVLLGGLIYDRAYRSGGLGAAIAAHIAHNASLGLGLASQQASRLEGRRFAGHSRARRRRHLGGFRAPPLTTTNLLLGLGIATALGFAVRAFMSPAIPDTSDFLAGIPGEAAPYAEVILRVAKETGVDPYLIAAIGQRESRWGRALSPPGPGGTGDAGHGRGLMQIDDRYHADWLAKGVWKDPYENVRYGVGIYKDMLAYFSSRGQGQLNISASTASRRGSIGGTFRDPRPLSEPLLTQAALAAYNGGGYNVLVNLALGFSPDYTTTGANYGADVLARATQYRADSGVA